MHHIHCAACGAELVENPALKPDQRPPCPACGSTDRRRSVQLTDTARAYDSLSLAVIRPAGIESAQAIGTPVVAHAEPAMVTVTAHDATVEAEDGQAGVEVEEALVEQGFQLWWQQLTASPVTWMAQVYDAAGEEIASGVGGDPVEILASLAERLIPHHPAKTPPDLEEAPVPSFCARCRIERDAATVGRSPCPDCGEDRVDAVAYVQPAHVTVTAPATVVTSSTGHKGAQGKAELSVRFEGRATGHRVRVVEETGTVVRVIRYQPPTEDGRRLGTVEDEHGNLRDLGAGDTPADSALEWIISGALLPDEGE